MMLLVALRRFSLRVALVYDRLNKVGGAEEILVALSELYPLADWYTSVYYPSRAPYARSWNIYPSFLNNIPFFRTRHEIVPFLMPFIFESFDFNHYDLVISIGSAEAKGIITRPETLHVNYCLTPTRYLWSHREEYLNNNQFGFFQKLIRPLGNKIMGILKKWDYVAAQRPDNMISISEHVNNRVQQYYHRESAVIYPPINLSKFNEQKVKPEFSDYFLVVARLVPYKHLDLIVKAFNKSGRKLLIVGEGTSRTKLLSLAKPNIHFFGFVPDTKLIGLYQNCNAFIQANEEDFGIAMCEALAAGRPVIAYNKGGAKEIINPGINGLLFDSQTTSGLNTELDKYDRMNFSPQKCRSSVIKFDKVQWKRNYQLHINDLCQKQLVQK